MKSPLCWCGSGEMLRNCHARLPRSGPGAATHLSPANFDWALRPASRTARRPAPSGVPTPEYALSGTPSQRRVGEFRSAEEIAALRRTCRAAAQILSVLGELVRPGMTTEEIDAVAYAECRRRGAYPSTLNYNGFSHSICTSVNEVICHGIPDARPLREGDIVNLDVTIYREGVHGDCSATHLVGEVNPVARKLVAAAREALAAGVAAVGPERPLSAIGLAIDSVAAKHCFSVVRDYVGHGIGPAFHTGLQVPHHFIAGPSPRMLPDMVFTVEPMLNAGSPRTTQWDDGWTAVTADLARSAQFEHTVLVTPTGVEILTLPEEEAPSRRSRRAG